METNIKYSMKINFTGNKFISHEIKLKQLPKIKTHFKNGVNKIIKEGGLYLRSSEEETIMKFIPLGQIISIELLEEKPKDKIISIKGILSIFT